MFSAIYIAPAHLAWIILDDSFLHCLVFKEHRRPLCYLSANQLLYLTSFSSFCQELFFRRFFQKLSPFMRLSPVSIRHSRLFPGACQPLFADDLYYITRFFAPRQEFFAIFLSKSAKNIPATFHKQQEKSLVFFLIQQFNELFFWNWSWKIIALD